MNALMKIAVTLDDLRKATSKDNMKNLVKRHIGDDFKAVRKGGLGKGPVGMGSLGKMLDRKDVKEGVAAQISNAKKSLSKKQYREARVGHVNMTNRMRNISGKSGRIMVDGDSAKNVSKLLKQRGGNHSEKFKKIIGKTSKEGREVFNRAILSHEKLESKKKQLGSNSAASSFFGHRSVQHPLQDLNIAATLKGKGADASKALKNLRKPEVNALHSIIPETKRLNLGEKRVSRHAMKRLQGLYEKRTAQ